MVLVCITLEIISFGASYFYTGQKLSSNSNTLGKKEVEIIICLLKLGALNVALIERTHINHGAVCFHQAASAESLVMDGGS